MSLMKMVEVRDFETGHGCELTAKQEKYVNYYIERIIKANIDVIVLCILKDTPMCGHDVIKSIFRKYNIFLSQGTVYPLLYSLRDQGILQEEVDENNMRSKIYSLTPDGGKIVEDRLSGFILAEMHIFNTIDSIALAN